MFELESEMIAPLTRSIPRLLIPKGPYAVACEVPDGARVVDIMYAILPEGPSAVTDAAGVASRLSRLSVAQIMVLALIWREGKVSSSRLSSLTYIAADELRAGYLGPFLRSGLVQLEGRSWAVGSWGEASPRHFIAVEAKLKDWREAVRQACDNKRRADYSYVALPKLGSGHARQHLLVTARDAGVGIIELQPDGDAEVVLRARRTPAAACAQKWQLAVRLLADPCQANGRWALSDQLVGA